MSPTSAQQDAVALLTVAMNASSEELAELVAEFTANDPDGALVVALVSLCRSLCMATSRVVHTLDDALSDEQAFRITDDELLPVAMEIVRLYARTAALNAERRDAT